MSKKTRFKRSNIWSDRTCTKLLTYNIQYICMYVHEYIILMIMIITVT